MKNIFCNIVAVTMTAITLSGCGGLNAVLAERQETVEMYHIFDIKTLSKPDAVIKGAADGLARNTNSIVQSRPLQMNAQVPITPGRFELVSMADMFKGSNIGNLMGAAGTSPMRMAKCDNALWNSKATRSITGSNNLTMYSCLYQYKGGYHLDIYAVFQKVSGGAFGVAREAASAIVGSPEQWVNKTIVDTVRSIESAAATKVIHIEGQPEIGELPMVDKLTLK